MWIMRRARIARITLRARQNDAAGGVADYFRLRTAYLGELGASPSQQPEWKQRLSKGWCTASADGRAVVLDAGWNFHSKCGHCDAIRGCGLFSLAWGAPEHLAIRGMGCPRASGHKSRAGSRGTVPLIPPAPAHQWFLHLLLCGTSITHRTKHLKAPAAPPPLSRSPTELNALKHQWLLHLFLNHPKN